MLTEVSIRMHEALFPSRCLACRDLCRDPGAPFCEVCELGIWPTQRPWCERCGRPMHGRPEDQRVCLGCAAEPPPFDRLRAAFFYGGPLADAIIAYKHGGHAEYGARLGRMMVGSVAAELGKVDHVVPVPLHPRRARRRGFNQAVILAREVSSAVDAPVRQLLRRVRDTGSQKGRTREERFAELAGAFDARVSRTDVGGRILLVDDVVTTGATIRGCAAALQRAGISEISALLLARAP